MVARCSYEKQKPYSQQLCLASRTALITGGAGFLGMNFAKSLLANNCSVIISDVSVEALSTVQVQLQELFPDGRLHTILLDVTSQDSILKLLKDLNLNHLMWTL